MLLMSVTLEVSKPETSSSVRLLHLLNIYAVLVRAEESMPERFSVVRLEQSANMNAARCTFEKSALVRSMEFAWKFRNIKLLFAGRTVPSAQMTFLTEMSFAKACTSSQMTLPKSVRVPVAASNDTDLYSGCSGGVVVVTVVVVVVLVETGVVLVAVVVVVVVLVVVVVTAVVVTTGVTLPSL